METYQVPILMGDESSQMWDLNRRLEAYLSRVKDLEEENELLRAEIQHLRAQPSGPSIRRYHEEIMKLRGALDDSHRAMVEVEIDRDNIYQEIQHVEELCLQEKQAQEEVKKEMAESKKLLEEEKRAQIWMKERLLQLEKEMEDILRVHEEEKIVMEEEISSFSQRLDNFKLAPLAFQPVNVEDYAIRLSQIWQGAVEEYTIEVSSLENDLSEAKENLRKVLEENKQSQLQLQSLQRELLSLKTRKEKLEEHIGRQWLDHQEEEGKLQVAIEALEKEKQELRGEITRVLEDRQHLMHLKMSLSLEVATYRSLLEAESTRICSPTADYTLSSPFSTPVLEKSLLRKRQNENTKKPAKWDYKLQSAKKSEQLAHSPCSYLNVKSASFSNRPSPVTKEFQKVSSVLQSQSLKHTKASIQKTATPMPLLDSHFEKCHQPKSILKKSKVETTSYSYAQDSAKASTPDTTSLKTKAQPLDIDNGNYSDLNKTDTASYIDNSSLLSLPNEEEITEQIMDILASSLKIVKDHHIVSDVIMEDQGGTLKVDIKVEDFLSANKPQEENGNLDIQQTDFQSPRLGFDGIYTEHMIEKKEVDAECVSSQRIFFEKESAVQPTEYQNIELTITDNTEGLEVVPEHYTTDIIEEARNTLSVNKEKDHTEAPDVIFEDQEILHNVKPTFEDLQSDDKSQDGTDNIDFHLTNFDSPNQGNIIEDTEHIADKEEVVTQNVSCQIVFFEKQGEVQLSESQNTEIEINTEVSDASENYNTDTKAPTSTTSAIHEQKEHPIISVMLEYQEYSPQAHLKLKDFQCNDKPQGENYNLDIHERDIDSPRQSFENIGTDHIFTEAVTEIVSHQSVHVDKEEVVQFLEHQDTDIAIKMDTKDQREESEIPEHYIMDSKAESLIISSIHEQKDYPLMSNLIVVDQECSLKVDIKYKDIESDQKLQDEKENLSNPYTDLDNQPQGSENADTEHMTQEEEETETDTMSFKNVFEKQEVVQPLEILNMKTTIKEYVDDQREVVDISEHYAADIKDEPLIISPPVTEEKEHPIPSNIILEDQEDSSKLDIKCDDLQSEDKNHEETGNLDHQQTDFYNPSQDLDSVDIEHIIEKDVVTECDSCQEEIFEKQEGQSLKIQNVETAIKQYMDDQVEVRDISEHYAADIKDEPLIISPISEEIEHPIVSDILLEDYEDSPKVNLTFEDLQPEDKRHERYSSLDLQQTDFYSASHDLNSSELITEKDIVTELECCQEVVFEKQEVVQSLEIQNVATAIKEYMDDQGEVLDISEHYTADIKDKPLIISPITEEKEHHITSDFILEDQEYSPKIDIIFEDLQPEDKLHEEDGSLDLQQTDFYSPSHNAEKKVVTELESCHEVVFEKQEVVQSLEIQNVKTAIKEYIEDQKEVLDISEHYAAYISNESLITSQITEEKEHPIVSDIISKDQEDFPTVDTKREELQSEDKHHEGIGSLDLQQTDFYSPSHDFDSSELTTEKDIVTELEGSEEVVFEKQEVVQSHEIQNVETAIKEYVDDQGEVLDISEHYAADIKDEPLIIPPISEEIEHPIVSDIILEDQEDSPKFNIKCEDLTPEDTLHERNSSLDLQQTDFYSPSHDLNSSELITEKDIVTELECCEEIVFEKQEVMQSLEIQNVATAIKEYMDDQGEVLDISEHYTADIKDEPLIISPITEETEHHIISDIILKDEEHSPKIDITFEDLQPQDKLHEGDGSLDLQQTNFYSPSNNAEKDAVTELESCHEVVFEKQVQSLETQNVEIAMKAYIEDQVEVRDISEHYAADIKDEPLIISPITEEKEHPIVSDIILEDQDDYSKVDITFEDLQPKDKLHERNGSLDLQQTDFCSPRQDAEKDVTEFESCHEVVFENQEVVQFLEIQNAETAIKEHIEDQIKVQGILEHYVADANKKPLITSPLTEEKEHTIVSDIIKDDDQVDSPKVDIKCEDLQSEDKHHPENGNADLQQSDFYNLSHDLDSADIEHITEKDVVTEFESCQEVFFEKQEVVQSLEIQNVETAIKEYIEDQREVLDISEHYVAEEEEIVIEEFQEINLLKESPNQLFYSEENISDKSKENQKSVELNDVSDDNMRDSPQIIDTCKEQEMNSFHINEEEPKDIDFSVGEQHVEGVKELQMESHILEDQVTSAPEIQGLKYETHNSECTENTFESQQSQVDVKLKLEGSESPVQDSEGGIPYEDQSKQEGSILTPLKEEFHSLEEERGSVVSGVEEICVIYSKGEYVSQLLDTFQENSQVSETFEEPTYVELEKITMTYIEQENDVLAEQQKNQIICFTEESPEQSALNDKEVNDHLEDVDLEKAGFHENVEDSKQKSEKELECLDLSAIEQESNKIHDSDESLQNDACKIKIIHLDVENISLLSGADHSSKDIDESQEQLWDIIQDSKIVSEEVSLDDLQAFQTQKQDNELTENEQTNIKFSLYQDSAPPENKNTIFSVKDAEAQLHLQADSAENDIKILSVVEEHIVQPFCELKEDSGQELTKAEESRPVELKSPGTPVPEQDGFIFKVSECSPNVECGVLEQPVENDTDFNVEQEILEEQIDTAQDNLSNEHEVEAKFTGNDKTKSGQVNQEVDDSIACISVNKKEDAEENVMEEIQEEISLDHYGTVPKTAAQDTFEEYDVHSEDSRNLKAIPELQLDQETKSVQEIEQIESSVLQDTSEAKEDNKDDLPMIASQKHVGQELTITSEAFIDQSENTDLGNQMINPETVSQESKLPEADQQKETSYDHPSDIESKTTFQEKMEEKTFDEGGAAISEDICDTVPSIAEYVTSEKTKEITHLLANVSTITEEGGFTKTKQEHERQALTITSETCTNGNENTEVDDQLNNTEPDGQEPKLSEVDQQLETGHELPSFAQAKTTSQEEKEEENLDKERSKIDEDTCDKALPTADYVTSEKTEEITQLLEGECSVTEEEKSSETGQEYESKVLTIPLGACLSGSENTETNDQLNNTESDSQEQEHKVPDVDQDTSDGCPSDIQFINAFQEQSDDQLNNIEPGSQESKLNEVDLGPEPDHETPLVCKSTEEYISISTEEQTCQDHKVMVCQSAGHSAGHDSNENNVEGITDFRDQMTFHFDNAEEYSGKGIEEEISQCNFETVTQTLQQEGSIDFRNLEVDQELQLDHDILASTDNKIIFQQKIEEHFEKGREEEMIEEMYEEKSFKLSSGEQESKDSLTQQQTQIICNTEEITEEFIFNDKVVIDQLNYVQPSCFKNVEDSEQSSQKEQECLDLSATKQEDKHIEGKDGGSSEECACKVTIIQPDVEKDEQDHNSEQQSLEEFSSNNLTEDVNKENIENVSKTEKQSTFEENEDEDKNYMDFKDDKLPEIDDGTLCRVDDKIAIQQESEQHFNINRPAMEQDTSEKNEDVKKTIQKESIAESTVTSRDTENTENIDQINSFKSVSDDSRNHEVGHQPELYYEGSSDIEPIFQQESAEVYHQKDAAEEISQDHYQMVSKTGQENSKVNKEHTEGCINLEPVQETELCEEHVFDAKPMCAIEHESTEGYFLEGSDKETVHENEKDIKDSWDSQADKEQAFVQESLSYTESYYIFQEESKEAAEQEIRQKADEVLPKIAEPETSERTEEENQSIKAECCTFTEFRTIVVNEEYKVPVPEIKYEGLISECDQTDDSTQPSDFEPVSQDSTYSVILQEAEMVTGLHRNTEGKESFHLESEHETFGQSSDLTEFYQEKHEAISRTEVPSTFDEKMENQQTGPDFGQDKFITSTQQENESLLNKIEESVKGSDYTQCCKEESVDPKACLMLNTKVELTCSTVDVNKQEKEIDADHISYTEANYTSHLESKSTLLDQWHGEKETSEENVEVASTTRTFGDVKEVVALQGETEGNQVMEFSLNFIQTNIKFTSENDVELQAEVQENKMGELSTNIVEASGDEAVSEKQSKNVCLQNYSIEKDSINMGELFLKVRGITESNQTMEEENIINEPVYPGPKYIIELNNRLQEIQFLESGSTKQAEEDTLSVECENGFSEHNIEQKLLAESTADQEGTSEKQRDTEKVPVFSSLEDEYSKSDESLDSQDISIYSQKSEDFEISKDYQCEQTLPDSTPLPNLDDEFEEFGNDTEIASEQGQNVTEPLFENKKGDMLKDSLESQSLQIVTEAILSSQIIAEAILSKSNEAELEYGHNTKDGKQVSEDFAFGTLDELRVDDQNQSDAEGSKLEYVSRECEDFVNVEENILSCLQASDELESSTNFQLPESLSTATTLCQLVEKSEISTEKQINVQSEQVQTDGIEELHFDNTDESNFTIYMPEDQINLHSEQPKTVDIEELKEVSCEESGFLTDEATKDNEYLSETKELFLTAEHSELTIPLTSDTIEEENRDGDPKHIVHDSMEKENVLNVNQFDKASEEYVPEIPKEIITDSNETEDVKIFTKGESIDGNEELITGSSVKPSFDFLHDYKGDEKIEMQNTEILKDAQKNVEVTEKTLGESVILETDEFTSSAETSPNVTAISHGLELEDSRDRTTKESFSDVSIIESFEGFLKTDSEREVMKEPPEGEALSQYTTFPEHTEFHTSDEEKDTTGDTSDSSFDSNSGNEREITNELHCTQTECHMQSETVNGLHEHTIVQATLDLEDLMFNGHFTDKQSKIVISERKTIVKVEEDIITTHTKDIIEEPILKFATSEGKNEGLFQSLLEHSEIKEGSRFAECSEFHVTEVDSVAEESSYNKKILKTYVTDTDFSGQSEVKSSLVEEDLIADTKQIAETHQEIPSIAFKQEKEDSWSSDE
ncbi:uncharacterized protein [Hyperolius riggenbachi]|uniref:uncharacterized protein n=1 Tax=Hyperolius riggenbachi TaxID=752182 RepID=UPI0035A2F9C2